MADDLEQLSKRELIALVRRRLGVVDRLEARVAQLEQENARLNARLKKDSSTSSKPPSSDIVKPPAPKPGKGRKRVLTRFLRQLRAASAGARRPSHGLPFAVITRRSQTVRATAVAKV